MTERMPPRLRAIQEEAVAYRPRHSNLDALQPIWDAHMAQAREQIPELQIEAGGEAVYLGDLSPGCRSCKEGTWDCIFITMRCNLDCSFCYSPHALAQDFVASAFGRTQDEIGRNHARTHITGISFSGGEAFLEPDKLFEWVAWFKQRFPEKYTWVYTNGLLATEGHLRRLKDLGVDEIRFNLAATGYDHPTVVEHLVSAGTLLPNLTVEIPAIPAHATKLLASLADWSALGVKFLNLHELIYEPGSNSATLPGARQLVVTADKHRCEIDPDSRALTLAVMKQVQDEKLLMAVNDCSLQSKLGQLRGRRQSLAPLMIESYEKPLGNGVYESICAYRADQVRFFHPDDLPELCQQYPDHHFVRLHRLAPLSVHEGERWVRFERLD